MEILFSEGKGSKIPRIVIAGTNSGCGKTTLTVGILAALVKRGLKIQPFKVGPDYIDPMFHTFVTGLDSRNLDSWLLNEQTVLYLFQKNASGKDIAVIEGVMGLHDGFGGESNIGSTAHLASILHSPVILMVNGEGMSMSIAALIQGYRDFNSDVDIKGVILNNINNDQHFQFLKEIIEKNTVLKAIGYLPRLPEISISDRHLGLVPCDEIMDLKEKIGILAQQVNQTIDLDLLLQIADEAEAIKTISLEPKIRKQYEGVRIAVAKDRAFNFYYADNLDLLRLFGAELVFFSPLNDRELPEEINGLYLGGGFPEVWAEGLRDNIWMRESIKQKIVNGLPTYAECGGLMYLTRFIKDKEGRTFEMVGVIPGNSEMTSALKRFGYVELEVISTNVSAPIGEKTRAHEFHYSQTMVDSGTVSCYKVLKMGRNKESFFWNCGYQLYNLLAGYPHLHWWSNPVFAEGFLKNCSKYDAMIEDNYGD